MRRLLMKRNVSLLCRSVLRFVDISACTFMACFLNCFRVRDDRSATNLVSDSSLSKSKKGRDSQNHLSASFLCEDKAAASSPCDKGRFDLDSIYIDKGLRDEARFLKACGTIPETPIEIRKASQKQNSPQDSGSSPFHSWISSSSALAFHLDEPRSSMKAGEELERPLFTSDHTPSRASERITASNEADEGESFRTALKEDLHISGRPMLTAGKTKSVRFECESHSSNSPKNNNSSRKAEMRGKASFTGSSPYPTPLKLSDEMQTPGTIYPANMESGGKGKPRIRSQFVHSVSNLMESATLSPCLNPINEDCKENIGDDRLFGVAVITPCDKKTEISPKWDGNGIPNSTRKYKEDQKVSWHATPFEVRLEKALSEEGGQSLYPRRNLEVMEEDEEEEDTEISQLRHHSA